MAGSVELWYDGDNKVWEAVVMVGRELRLVALDLDGTLLDTDKRVSDRCRAVLGQLAARGVWIVPVTGRPALPEEVRSLPGLRYAVTSNGVKVADVAAGTVLHERLLPPETAAAVLAAAEPFPVLREVVRGGMAYVSQADFDTLMRRHAGTAMERYLRSSRTVLPGTAADLLRAEPLPVEELYFLGPDGATRDALQAALAAAVPQIGFVHPSPRDLEVVDGTADKGTGLAWLLARLGIDPAAVLAAGDERSDLPMLRLAGVSVAMGNGHEDVRRAADIVTDTCDQDGVAKVLERYL